MEIRILVIRLLCLYLVFACSSVTVFSVVSGIWLQGVVTWSEEISLLIKKSNAYKRAKTQRRRTKTKGR